MIDLIAVAFGLVAMAAQAIAPVCFIGFPPAHASGGFSVVICSVHGSQTVTLDANGNPIPVAPDKGGTDTQCPMCGAFHAPPLLAPFAGLLVAVLFFWRSAAEFAIVTGRAPRCAFMFFITRGPPAAFAA
jgi:Protein of unknown function (DUF2946)